MSIAQFLLSLTIILAPLYVIRWSYFIPGINISLPTTLLEFLVWITLVANAFEFIKDKGKLLSLKTSFDKLILLFLISGVISVVISPELYSGFGIFRAYILEPIIFYYVLVYQMRKGGYRFVFNSLFVSGLWLSTLGVIQKITGGFTPAPHEILQGRISAVYNSANALALFAGPIAVLALARFIIVKDKLKKMLYLLNFAILSLVIYWTRSRGGVMAEGAAVSVFAYLLILIKESRLRKIWYLFPIGIAISFVIFFYTVFNYYGGLRQDISKPYKLNDTLNIRYYIWEGSINLLKDHPILGAGLNGFNVLYANEYRLPEIEEKFQYPHNMILTFWSEMGLLGLISFLAILTLCFIKIGKNLFQSREVVLGAALAGMLSFWIFHGLVDVPYFKNDLSLEFWILVALVEVWSLNAKEHN